jgi:3-oxoacyl-[acyl-carrier-protein] synthase III
MSAATTGVGILAVGMYVPPEVRRNDWWPPEVVAGWMAARQAARKLSVPAGLGEGASRVLRAWTAEQEDPFCHTIERRVLAADRPAGEMAELAARDALDRAGVDPASIDLLLTHEVVPDHQMVNPACPLHHALRLSPTCLALQTEATAYTSLAQLALAEAMIASGRARRALLVQSCAASRLVDAGDPGSVLVGDGATALVVGPVGPGRGILSSVHHTDGRYPRGLIASAPGGRWYDGRARMHVADPGQLFEAQLRIADVCASSIRAALEKSGHALADVDHLCVFQGKAWIPQVVHEHLGIGRPAPPSSVFRRFAYLSSAMIPAALFGAQEEGSLTDGDLVVLCGGGTGMTYGAAVLRWAAR